MEKRFWESKAMWGAILTFVVGGLTATGYIEVAQAIGALALTLGISIVGIRHAQK